MSSEDPKIKRAQKIIDAGDKVDIAQLTEAIATNEKLDALLAQEKKEEKTEAIEEVSVNNFPEFPSEFSVTNLPEVQKVEVINFPKEEKPVINVAAPTVIVDAPIVEMNNEDVLAELKNIAVILSQEETETIEKTEIVDGKGKTVDFRGLFSDLAESLSHIKGGGGGGATFPTQSQNDLRSLAQKYTTLIDTTTTSNTIYVGKAVIGSTTSSPVWQISKVDTTGISVKWAGASSDFLKVWDNRASFSYS